MGAADMQEIQQRLKQLRNGGLNENYGRELLELHTLGVDGGYTQQDVINVARALTGWTIRPPAAGGGFIFRPEMHDAGEKVVLGHKLKAGRGIEDGEDVLDIVSRHPATAQIHRDEARAPVYLRQSAAGSDRPGSGDFTKPTATFARCVRTIVTSNEFYSQQAYRSQGEITVRGCGECDARNECAARQHTSHRSGHRVSGRALYGHQAPNGYPETNDAWMNTGAILNESTSEWRLRRAEFPAHACRTCRASTLCRQRVAYKQVDGIVSLLLGGSASPDTRAVLISGENPLVAKATVQPGSGAELQPMDGDQSMDASRTQPSPYGRRPGGNPLGRPGSPVPQLTGLAQVIGLALGSPEFQRR